jgi:hypothetical protein
VRIARGEGDIAEPLSDLAKTFGDLSFGSYPYQKDGLYGANVVIRGTDSAALDEAANRLFGLFGSDAS